MTEADTPPQTPCSVLRLVTRVRREEVKPLKPVIDYLDVGFALRLWAPMMMLALTMLAWSS